MSASVGPRPGNAAVNLAGLLGVEGSGSGLDADLLDGISSAAFVADADYDAHTILQATSDNTPVALTVGEQTVVGRVTGGNIVALTATQLETILDDVEISGTLDIIARSGGTESKIGNFGPASEPALALGGDAVWYRSAADVLRTADSVVATNALGVQSTRFSWTSAANVFLTFVSGSPEGVTTATVGAAVLDATNGVVYLKTLGSANTTGWAPVAGPRVLNNQTGTTYALVLADQGKLITLSNAAGITATIPANASVAYPIGTTIDFMQIGAGQVTLAITSDTLSTAEAGLKLRAQYSRARVTKITATQWVASGDLAA